MCFDFCLLCSTQFFINGHRKLGIFAFHFFTFAMAKSKNQTSNLWIWNCDGTTLQTTFHRCAMIFDYFALHIFSLMCIANKVYCGFHFFTFAMAKSKNQTSNLWIWNCDGTTLQTTFHRCAMIFDYFALHNFSLTWIANKVYCGFHLFTFVMVNVQNQTADLWVKKL